MLLVSLMEMEKKQQHEHAYSLLRECLRNLRLEMPDEKGFGEGAHGKPYLLEYPHVHFNLSHGDGITACLVKGLECGIDCEKVKDYKPNVVKRCFSESEKKMMDDVPEKEKDKLFYRLWTLKEAYVKALGTGIGYPLDEVEFEINGEDIDSNVDGYSFRQYLLRGGKYVVSVCEKTKVGN